MANNTGKPKSIPLPIPPKIVSIMEWSHITKGLISLQNILDKGLDLGKNRQKVFNENSATTHSPGEIIKRAKENLDIILKQDQNNRNRLAETLSELQGLHKWAEEGNRLNYIVETEGKTFRQLLSDINELLNSAVDKG